LLEIVEYSIFLFEDDDYSSNIQTNGIGLASTVQNENKLHIVLVCMVGDGQPRFTLARRNPVFESKKIQVVPIISSPILKN